MHSRSPETGLDSPTARARLAEHGPNALAQERAAPLARVIARQFASPMVALLLGAAGVAAMLGEAGDAAAIAAIVALNAAVGAAQEAHAERAVLALRALTAPRARVLRDGRPADLPAADVVPGDVLLLEAGDVVPADARLDEAHRLTTLEAVLTGESTPVEKRAGDAAAGEAPARSAPAGDAPSADDRVYAGTAIATGTGRATVTATGMHTELGRIARLLGTAQHAPTPLQVQLGGVQRTLIVACLGVVAGVAALGLARGERGVDVLIGAVSLAVAAVPEGLPAVVTIALAVGVRRMARRNVLVRRLSAVETLGATTVLCTDKTGTLTTGQMRVAEIWGDDPERLLYIAAACNDADLAGPVGDPTEIALLLAAGARGIERADIERAAPRVAVEPFDAARKRMVVQRADGVRYVKGAPEAVLPRCAHGLDGADEAQARLAAAGLRVLALAEGAADDGWRLRGLVGVADPPRPGAPESVARAREAGVRVVMITGDHPSTARSVARSIGILRDGDDAALHVHARATPEDKLRIVRAWKARGAVVAMTGDGVNDAPALREAHIGVAMGRRSADVTREAADMVLTDDDFSSIVAAIREGRGVRATIRGTLVYLLTGNVAELAIMVGAAALGLPLPLLPRQLLWINLVTDGPPALARVLDRADPGLLRQPPSDPTAPMLGAREWGRIGVGGAVQAAAVLLAYVLVLRASGVEAARAVAFAGVVYGELARAVVRRGGVRRNPWLYGVVAVSAALQAIVQGTAWGRGVFGVG